MEVVQKSRPKHVDVFKSPKRSLYLSILLLFIAIVVATVVAAVVCVHALHLLDILRFEVDMTSNLVSSSFFTVNEP